MLDDYFWKDYVLKHAFAQTITSNFRSHYLLRVRAWLKKQQAPKKLSYEKFQIKDKIIFSANTLPSFGQEVFSIIVVGDHGVGKNCITLVLINN